MNKKVLIFLFFLSLGALGAWMLVRQRPSVLPTPFVETPFTGEEVTEDVSIIASNLSIPWDIAFLPDGSILITERPGRLTKLSKDGSVVEIPVEGVKHFGEGGLLGMTLHPNFRSNQFLYLYMSAPAGSATTNRVERYKLIGNSLTEKTVIIEGIPGAIYHDGGRIEFGPDRLLYVTTGDATDETLAQNKSSLAGKILRMDENGEAAPGNPFGDYIYSFGHRNPQGIAWDSSGRLWSTEHGRSGVASGFDEVNLIVSGANYGWPTIQGDETAPGMLVPKLQSGATKTWAPASAAYLNGSLFFGGLRGETLYEAVLSGDSVKELKEHFVGEFGRIRTVRVGPDGFLYITTSNTDGRGSPSDKDDMVIRINPASL